MWASSFRIRAIWIQWSECRASPLLLPWSAKTLITAPYFRHSWRNSRDPSGLRAAQLFLGRSSWLGLKSSAFPVWCFLFKEGVLRVPYSPKKVTSVRSWARPSTPWDTLRHPETPCHPNVSPWLSCYFPVTFTRCIMLLFDICMDIVEELWICRQIHLRRVEHAVQNLGISKGQRSIAKLHVEGHGGTRTCPNLPNTKLLPDVTRCYQ